MGGNFCGVGDKPNETPAIRQRSRRVYSYAGPPDEWCVRTGRAGPFYCHQSANIAWPIGGACGPPIRDIHSPKGRSQAGGSTDQPPHRPSTNKHKSPVWTKPSGAVSLGGGAQTPRKSTVLANRSATGNIPYNVGGATVGGRSML